MKQILAFALLSIILTGCSNNKAIIKNYSVEDQDKYVSINLDISAGRYISVHEAEVVDYIYDSFENSNLFTSIETGFARYPITIQVRYSWEQPSAHGAEGAVKGAVAGATLLLVPVSFDEIHHFKVKFLADNKVIETFEYSEKIETALSLYDDPVEDRKNGVNQIMSRLFKDMKEKQIIPTIAELNDEIKSSNEITL